MYDIYLRPDYVEDYDGTNDRLLWAPGLEDKGYILYSAILELEMNHSGKFTYQMSPNHPEYHKILKRKTLVIVRRNNVEYWRGRVLDFKTDFYNRRTVICEGILSILLDTVVRPYEYDGPFSSYIEYMLSQHNGYSDYAGRVEVGDITAVDSTNYIVVSNLTPSTYQSTLEELNDQLVDRHGGYLRVRTAYSDGREVQKLDYLSGSGELINQQVKFGKNLLDFEEYITAENVCTCCVPLGPTLREIEEYKIATESSYISTLDPADANKRLTIVTDTLPDDFIENSEAIKVFGRVTKCVVFDDVNTVHDSSELQRLGQTWLDNNWLENVTMEIKAIDLSLVVEDIDAIDCGKLVNVISEPHYVSTSMVCRAMTLNILSPGETVFKFGSGFNTLTDQQAGVTRQTSKAFNTAISAQNNAATVSGQSVSVTDFNNFKEQVDNRLIPTATSLDEGKVLKVSEGKWVKSDESELPAVTTSDNGKVLKILDGKWVAAAVETLSAPTISIDGDILTIVDDSGLAHMFSITVGDTTVSVVEVNRTTGSS